MKHNARNVFVNNVFVNVVALIALSFASVALAGKPPGNGRGDGVPNGQPAAAPDCFEQRSTLPINNEKMLHVKETEKNQFLARGNLYGTITHDFDDSKGHLRFEMQIGNRSTDVVEIIYNVSFGPVAFEVKPGMRVQACGDFINSFAPTERYPASPSGAIIHWLHLNPRNQGQEHGFLQIEGRMFGYDWDFAQKADDQRNKERKNNVRRLNPFLPAQYAHSL